MSMDITIEGVTTFHVCGECGSPDWHLNLVVKRDQWYLDPDWEMYCNGCAGEYTIEDLVHIREYKEVA
jgi:hypothetical protein